MMLRLLVIVAAGLCCMGCAGWRAGGAAAPALAPDPRAASAFRGQDGMPLGWDELLSEVGHADVIIIGEQHGHPAGLAVAAALWEDLLERAIAPALSLEFFSRDEQSRIDDYLAGLSDEATFKRRTGRSEGNYPAGHRAMLEAAKEAGRPVYAANAPRAAVGAARRDGFERLHTLSEEQRRLFRIPDALPEGRYRSEFEKLMGDALASAHGVDEDDPEAQARMVAGMLRAQSLWDWTMAHTIARAVQGGDVPVVHVVGRFHSDFDGGLVQALESLAPGLRIVTVSMADEWSEELAADDVGRASVVVYVGPRGK